MPRDATSPWGRWLRRYRDERDLTQEALGEVLGVDGKLVSAWENGRRPSRRHARTICSALRTSRTELGLVEPRAQTLIGRREFMRQTAGLGGLAIFGPWAGLDRLDAPAVDVFSSVTDALERLWPQAGVAAAFGPALGHVESMTRLLEGSLPAPVRPGLCGALAEGLALLARLKSWLGDPDGADHFAELGVEAAREAGDHDLAIHVVIGHASADRRLHDRPEVRLGRYVEGDHGFSVVEAGSATRAWAAAKAAEVHASMGDEGACLRALEDSARLLAGGRGRRHPWPDERWLAGERGVSLSLLGRTADARRALDTALAVTGEERAVDRLWWMLAVARAHAAEGDPSRAAGIALDVLGAARRLHHGQLEDEVGRLQATLTR